MKILAIGDVVGAAGVAYLQEKLSKIKEALGAAFVVVNGENAAEIHGISSTAAKQLLDCGADIITLGNHTFGRKDICQMLSDEANIIRPANYPPLCPGAGYLILPADGFRILCINVLGTAFMEPLACPFDTVDKILTREKGKYDFSLLDIHAEATSEKMALGRYFDGRINIIFGTHTHVQTADEQVFPGGTGYITDLGMTGPSNGVIGTDAAEVIERFRTKMPVRFNVADGAVIAHGALFDLDTTAGRVISVRRVTF